VPPGRTLCLDVGERRIGVALSDPEGRLASPLGVIVRRGAARDFEQVAQLVRQHGVERVVVGLPRTLAGELGPQARRVQRWAERLRAHLPVPLVYWDERYSTVEATRRLAASGSRRRTALDAAAAAVILQDYLDTAR
jgi:putative Holliday junction resolvase